MTAPTKLSIRSYGVGFGDCFLLSFAYPNEERHVLVDFGSMALPEGVPKKRMMEVAEDIRTRSGGKLTAVVATHRHKDHISGFRVDAQNRGSGRIIADLKPDLVLQPWTEDPTVPIDADAPPPPPDTPGLRRLRHLHSLAAMQRVAASTLAEAKRSRYLRYASKALREQIAFLGEDNISNASAVRNLMTMGRNEYLHAGKRSGLEALLPGVEVHVLGPPTVTQHGDVRRQRADNEAEYWHLQAAAGTTLQPAGSGRIEPLFPGHVRPKIRGNFAVEARWLIHHARKIRAEQMLGIVRRLDRALNNTSLILLFRCGSKSLLFPGDAQWENWAFALSRPEYQAMLAEVDLYKVGHHGSLNATPKTLWNMFRKRSSDPAAADRMHSLMSTMAGEHGDALNDSEVPRGKLVTELQRDTNHFTTQQLDPLQPFQDQLVTF